MFGPRVTPRRFAPTLPITGRVERAPDRREIRHPMRVLIVDDHPIIVSGCAAMLAGEGDIDVSDARDAETGLAAYKAQRPDVAVVDIGLPGVSGFELARRILDHDAEARIVVFSMNDDPIFAARAIEAGAKAYVTKNDDPFLLLKAVRGFDWFVIQGIVFLVILSVAFTMLVIDLVYPLLDPRINYRSE